MTQNRFRIFRIKIVLCFLGLLGFLISNAFSAENRTSDLNLVPTAKTLGKGGYSSSVAFFEYNKREPNRPEQFPRFEEVNIGFFKESHSVYFNADASLLPIRLSYGISENLDLTFGNTYSMGTVEKVISDYYQIGDEKIKRSYPQSLFDGSIGMKYGIKPYADNNTPIVAIGVEVQVGYTADDLSPSFGDPTPVDSYPFLGISTFMIATQDLKILILNAGISAYRSTKPESFRLGFYLGGELPLTDKLSFILDVSSFKAISGINYRYTLAPGIRYNFNQTVAINLGFNTTSGVQFGMFIGGEKPSALPKEKDDLLF